MTIQHEIDTRVQTALTAISTAAGELAALKEMKLNDHKQFFGNGGNSVGSLRAGIADITAQINDLVVGR